jgi:hypothetical protein
MRRILKFETIPASLICLVQLQGFNKLVSNDEDERE